MTKPFSRTKQGAVGIPKVPRPLLTDREREVLQVLAGLRGGAFGAAQEDDLDHAALALLNTVFERMVTQEQYEALVPDWEAALVQAARVQKLCCEPHWGWLPLCILDPFEGLNGQNMPIGCPLRKWCPIPDGYIF